MGDARLPHSGSAHRVLKVGAEGLGGVCSGVRTQGVRGEGLGLGLHFVLVFGLAKFRSHLSIHPPTRASPRTLLPKNIPLKERSITFKCSSEGPEHLVVSALYDAPWVQRVTASKDSDWKPQADPKSQAEAHNTPEVYTLAVAADEEFALHRCLVSTAGCGGQSLKLVSRVPTAGPGIRDHLHASMFPKARRWPPQATPVKGIPAPGQKSSLIRESCKLLAFILFIISHHQWGLYNYWNMHR